MTSRPSRPAPVALDADGLPTAHPDRELAVLSSRFAMPLGAIARRTGWSLTYVRERLRAWRFAVALARLAEDPLIDPEDHARRAWAEARQPIVPSGIPGPSSPHPLSPLGVALRAATRPKGKKPMPERHLAVVADRLRGHGIDVVARRAGLNIRTVVTILGEARQRL